jgi:predicted Zn-dependent protease
MDLNHADLQFLSARILDLVEADEAVVSIDDSTDLHLRHANNDITSNALTSRRQIGLSVSYGRRSASISFQETDPESLREAVSRVQAMAKLAPENPEHMPPVAPATFAEPLAFSEKTAASGPDDALRWVRPVIEAARAAGLESAGYLQKTVASHALANSSGLFVAQRQSSIGFSMTARTRDGGSGWASTQVTDSSDLDLGPVGERAIRKALASRHPAERPPGRVMVLLEPAAVRDLVSLLLWSLERRDFDEGRSFLNALTKDGKDPIGRQLFGTANLRSDPLFRPAPCLTHAGGEPLGPTAWIENGVLRNLVTGRYWAKAKGLESKPMPGNFFIPGEGQSMEKLIAQIKDGVLITRLWYLRMVRPESLLYTGLTRDGTFAIRNGELAGPVKNFRFNESPANVLRQILASGIPERVLGSESDGPAHVPPLVVDAFHLSSVSDAS